eukprot:5643340-Amphidinium_carterae.1
MALTYPIVGSRARPFGLVLPKLRKPFLQFCHVIPLYAQDVLIALLAGSDCVHFWAIVQFCESWQGHAQ